MPKTKMTKSKWALVVLVMIVIGATAIHRSMATNQPQDHQHHQQAQKDKPKTQPLIADGSVNPQAIPDIVAYEFLFNSVADGAGLTEPERIRARIFADRIGLEYRNYQVLRVKANEFRAKLTPLDAQAKELKDRNWPNPSESVKGQLGSLQAQKENMLKRQIKDLERHISASDKEKLNKRLLEIKSKVKMYEPLPVEKFKKQ